MSNEARGSSLYSQQLFSHYYSAEAVNSLPFVQRC